MIKKSLKDRLRCPECHCSGLDFRDSLKEVVCTDCQTCFPISIDRPVLIRHDNAIFPSKAYITSTQDDLLKRKSWMGRLIPSISVNLASSRCLGSFGEKNSGKGDIYILVVGSGSQRTWLDKKFETFPNVHLAYCDIDITALVDCYCDAHDLPFLNDCFDGVITTAVLEHVLRPERVVAEIHRVLKPNGLVYSEIPFMQQVHEGAYDFTRYTLSGHRLLFNHFAELDSGLVAGPATALAWAIENFTLAFFGGLRIRMILKAIVRTLFFWLKYFDYLLENKQQAIDGASCTYFMGSKQDNPISDLEIINGYKGLKNLNHV